MSGLKVNVRQRSSDGVWVCGVPGEHVHGGLIERRVEELGELVNLLDAEDRAELRRAVLAVLGEQEPTEWRVGDECLVTVRGTIAEMRDTDANVRPDGLLVPLGIKVRSPRFHVPLSALRRPEVSGE